MARAVRTSAAARRRPGAATRVAVAPSARLTVEQVNAINLGLMLASAGLAWVLPLEVLLASYAVLGPLHYLTEISWLHDRGYFTTGRYDVLALLGLGVAGVLERVGWLPWNGSVVLAFALAAVFAFVADGRLKIALLAVAALLALALQGWGSGWFFLVVMLPTVIHVFCFTGLFILHGSIKSRSPWGYASFAVFLICGVGLLAYQPEARQYSVSPRLAALGDEFGPVYDQLALFTGIAADPWSTLAAFARFLAFAYTYHYLNWFSKTGIIRWHTISGVRMAVIAVLYVAALALYAYDYRVGITALFALSLVHVLLEFPLDVRTIAGLGGRSD